MEALFTQEKIDLDLQDTSTSSRWIYGNEGEEKVQSGETLYGIQMEGHLKVETDFGEMTIPPQMAFCIPGEAVFKWQGTLMATSISNFKGLFQIVGPIEKQGRLRYIDGCTDTLLIPPLVMGNPCLNHLHFPTGIDQTLHTHPSYRVGLVLRGSGVCELEHGTQLLEEGMGFYLPSHLLHGFKTNDSTMDIIAFHPDSDHGPRNDDHPMVNRTIVNGVSARYLEEIQT